MTTPSASRHPAPGSTSQRVAHTTPMGWLPWLLLGLLVLLVVLGALLAGAA